MMTTTRSRDGTLPSRTYEAVVSGIRMSGHRNGTFKLPRGRPRKEWQHMRNALSIRNADHLNDWSNDADDPYAVPQVMCRMKAPNYRDEIADILGDDDEPYYGLFHGDNESSKTDNTRPTAEDRALCQQLNRSSSMDPSLRRINPHIFTSETFRAQTPQPEGTNLTIHFGDKYTMDAWYRSAYPAEYTRRDYLSVCCYCLEYTMSDLTAERHALKCCRRVPPGREIYRDGELSMWEVDGLHSSLYCQNLCLLAKSFLSSKSLYRDVQPFYFYVLTKADDKGAEFIGYFSKQKMYTLFKPEQPIQCVSCIMSLPFTQQQGYGQFLIDFSYLLARQQQATGSPETPLSDLGEKAFRSYWKRKMCYFIRDKLESQSSFTVSSLSRETGIHINHVVVALDDLGWLNKAGSRSNNPVLKVNKAQLNNIIADWESRNPVILKPELLMWAPLYD